MLPSPTCLPLVWVCVVGGMLSMLLAPPLQAQEAPGRASASGTRSGPPACTASPAVSYHEDEGRASRRLSACRSAWRPVDAHVAQDRPATPWIARDKALHLSYSALWTLSSQYLLVHKTALSHNASIPWALTSGFAVGLAKELYDGRRPQNFFSWRDMTANAVGIGLAAALIAL